MLLSEFCAASVASTLQCNGNSARCTNVHFCSVDDPVVGNGPNRHHFPLSPKHCDRKAARPENVTNVDNNNNIALANTSA